MPPSDPTPPTPARGDNTVKWVLAGCGGCLGLMVLAGLALAIFINRTLRFAVGPDQKPADGQALFTYAIPGESQGIFDLGLFGMQVTQVASTDSPPSVLLTMGQLPRYLQSGEAQRTFIEQFQENVEVEGTYQFSEQRVEERTLCDQPVSVVMQVGQFEEGSATYRAASLLTFVEYNNTTRFVWVLTHGDQPEATADQVFASLDCV